MTKIATVIALQSAALAEGKGWVHLLPKGRFTGLDGRGPYDATDLEGIVLNSRDAAGQRLMVIDYNHATDLAATKGEASPAAGWVVGLEARDDGIWGMVEWTPPALQHLANREYRYISPALRIDKVSGRISHVLRASLTNNPNLDQLTGLFAERPSDLNGRLRKLLNLAADADDDAIFAAASSQLTATHSAQPDPAKFVPIGDFQRTLAELNKLRQGISLQAAEEHVAAEIKGGRLPPFMKAWAVDLCTKNLDAFQQFVAGVGPGFTHLFSAFPPNRQPGQTDYVDPEDEAIARNMGLDPKKFTAFRRDNATD